VRLPTELPAGAALTVAALGGVASAAQSLANAELGARLGNPALGAVVNNAVAVAVMLGVLALLPPLRAGLRGLPRSGLPWWAYLGGLGGGIYVLSGVYAVPALGVALFTIAQVAGNGAGGLAVDRAGLAPLGRLPLTGPRIAGAVLGVAAVALAQLGRPLGELAWGALAVTAVAGFVVALQAAFNGRVAAASTNATSVAVNMVVSTPLVFAVALAAGAFADLPGASWPGNAALYLGGPLGLSVILALIVGVRAAGVLRTGLAIVAGQLAGAVVLDVVAGHRIGWALVAGAALTFVAVAISGRGTRRTAAGT
jgi:bacterial/archaeal transporter family-2 protein